MNRALLKDMHPALWETHVSRPSRVTLDRCSCSRCRISSC